MLADKVVGAWQLVSFTAEYLDRAGTFHPLGPDATGIIMYTADGYMSAQIMRPGRPDYALFDNNDDDVEQAAASATGYLAYSGPYTAHEASGTLHHEIEISLLPGWLGTTQPRQAAFEGSHMTLTAVDTLRAGRVRSVLVWKRASSHGR